VQLIYNGVSSYNLELQDLTQKCTTTTTIPSQAQLLSRRRVSASGFGSTHTSNQWSLQRRTHKETNINKEGKLTEMSEKEYSSQSKIIHNI